MFNRIADLVASNVSPDTIARLYQSTPMRMQENLALHRFRRTVRYAAECSPFYKRKFREHGIDPRAVRTPADLKDLYTLPEDLAENAEELLCEKPQLVFESSGTSGVNKRVYFSEADFKVIGVSAAGGFKLMGVTPQDRVCNAFDFSIWIPGMVCHYGTLATGAFCQPVGKCDPMEVWRRFDQYKYNVIMGEPTWLIRLTEIAEKSGKAPKVKTLVGGAEEVPVAAREWMERVWGGAKLRMCYAAVENASGLGFQPCDFSDGYHLDTANFLTEIIEKDAEGFGEIVFTTLCRQTMPLIRYRTRDVARMLPEPCKCGIPAPRISRIRGRRDELVVASGGNLYPLMFDRILHDVKGLTHDWQVVFYLEGVREVLEINVESERADHDQADRERIEAEIHRYANELYPDLMKNLALGIFAMRVVVHAPGTVRKARKLKRVVDRRHFDMPEAAETPSEATTGRPMEAPTVAPAETPLAAT